MKRVQAYFVRAIIDNFLKVTYEFRAVDAGRQAVVSPAPGGQDAVCPALDPGQGARLLLEKSFIIERAELGIAGHADAMPVAFFYKFRRLHHFIALGFKAESLEKMGDREIDPERAHAADCRLRKHLGMPLLGPTCGAEIRHGTSALPLPVCQRLPAPPGPAQVFGPAPGGEWLAVSNVCGFFHGMKPKFQGRKMRP